MKILFKKLLSLSLLAILASTYQLQADSVTYGPSTTAITSLIQRAARINQIVFSNAATNAVTLTFTDSPTNTLTYVVGAYTNNVYTIGDVTTIFTNRTGALQTNTVNTLTSTLSVQAATTNNYRQPLIQLVPASSTVTFTPAIGFNVGFGLAASSGSTNVTAVVTYQPNY